MSRFSNPVPQFFLDNGELASSGRMYFYENKNYSLLKSTFSQPDNTVANTNPLKLDGQGRLPNCFGEGLYSVKLYAANPDNPNIDGELIWTRDDVDLSAGGDAAFSAWSPVQTYGAGSIVKDGEPYYRLYGSAASKGEQPSLTPSKWEEIVFITEHIAGRSYPEDYIVKKDGYLYRSNTIDNTTTPPSADWENLTFNNSVTGDFSVGEDLTVVGGTAVGGALAVAGSATAATPAQSSDDNTLVTSEWVKDYWPKQAAFTPITLVVGMTGSASFILYGNICFVSISISNNAVTANPLLTLPVGARPSSTVRGSCVFIDNTNVSFAKSLTIDSSGLVNFSPSPVTANGSFTGMIIFPIV